MIGARARSKFDGRKVKRKADQGSFTSLQHAAGAIRLTVRRSIRRGKRRAAVGMPPNTRRGAIKNALAYAVDKQRRQAIIGTSAAILGPSGGAHEHGGTFRGRRYDKRPFMRPGLEKLAPRLNRFWADSIR